LNDWLFDLVEGKHWRQHGSATDEDRRETPFPTHGESVDDAFQIASQAAMARALTIVRIHCGLLPKRFAEASRRNDPKLFRQLLDHDEVDAALFWLDVLQNAGAKDPNAALANNILGYDPKSDETVPIKAMRWRSEPLQRLLKADEPGSDMYFLFEKVILELKTVLDGRKSLTPKREQRLVTAVGEHANEGLRLWEKELLLEPVHRLEADADTMLNFLLDQAREDEENYGWARDSQGRTVTAHETAKVLSAVAPHHETREHREIVERAAASLKRMRDERSKTWLHGLHGPTGKTSYLSTAFCCRALFRVLGDDDPEARQSAKKLQAYLTTKAGQGDAELTNGKDALHPFLTHCHILRAILTPRKIASKKTLEFARTAMEPLQELSLYASLRDDPERYALALATALLALRELAKHDSKAVDTERRYRLMKELILIANQKKRLDPFFIEMVPGPNDQPTEFPHATMPWIISALSTVPESNKAHLIASSLALTRHMTHGGGVDFRPAHDGTTWSTAYAFGAIKRSISSLKKCHQPGAFVRPQPDEDSQDD